MGRVPFGFSRCSSARIGVAKLSSRVLATEAVILFDNVELCAIGVVTLFALGSAPPLSGR